ncbi:Membrane protein involved in the export of O-antigen and teichoic acid [Salegentibacter echinorum]|uniref:Membrane protein involved in the export of O-antigen and teichoic acid n=1 Tax=Salegentibacter echinorum TaxID=1073325 RepID=A0A1M5DUI2_SALEC|nr:oligosaccharide flippase family protein [Salegentibacter echinorum]SHF70472.1 Membrane protein involved in the export of O-antigen and teichoic acid [Salegentibacter echinorum]
MSTLKRFFQDTIIYGFATVLPRLMNFILVPLHVSALTTGNYSINTTFYVWAAFFNVVLSFGMETAFFRFFATSKEKNKVFSTAFISLTASTIIFFLLVFIFREHIFDLLDLKPFYFNILLGVLALDALVVIPFAYLRASNRPVKFALVKIINIGIVVLLNFYFLWWVAKFPQTTPQFILDNYSDADKVGYIFLANLAASAVTFLILLPYFFRMKANFSVPVFKKMIGYSWPIMVAGLAFVINENLDKLLLKDMLSDEIMGAYSGCYKLAVFMTIFVQAFKLGAEPFFFNQAEKKNARQTYALILTYFVIAGSFILLFLVAFLDFFKELIIRNDDYWVTIAIVPVVLLANLFLGIYHNLSVWYKLTDKTRMGMYISVFGALITIGLNLLLIPVIGFMAAAWATLAAYGSMVMISYFLGRKYYPVPYNIKKIGFYLILSSGLSIISFLFFRENYIVASGFILLFLLIVYFMEQKQLRQLINSG